MIKTLFTNDLYIKVYKNTFEGKNLSTASQWQRCMPESPFTTARLLVGTFSAAEPSLSKLVKALLPKGILKRSPRIVIQPMEMVEGGLSEVEERLLKELALSAGAFKVVLHCGNELSDEEAIHLLQ